ncbi:MAG: hypothetical protein JXR78_12890 [Victivallales bacterium]|nr:hypothetical protein [Victivallales bacterium]
MGIEIYHYESSEKFYLRKEIIGDTKSYVGLPANSTDIKPPEYLEGHIPVFNGENWDIVEDIFWRPKVIELNYNAGRLRSTYKPISFSLFKHFPSYPSMPKLCNSLQVVMAISQKIKIIHQLFENLCNNHSACLKPENIIIDGSNNDNFCCSPSLIYKYRFEIESMVYAMKRVIDSLAQLTYLLTNYDDFDKNRRIPFDGIGKIFAEDTPYAEVRMILIGDDENFKTDSTGFLKIINDLFNSFKHSLMHDETYSLFCKEVPSIVSYQVKYNNHNKTIYYHNHNAYHIIMGFQDTIQRILNNQKEYISNKKSV